jgi:hypothetical protein
VEDRSRGLDPMVRVGRSAIGLLAVLIGLPVVVLMPLVWLESQLPLEAVPADLTVVDRARRGRQRPPLGNGALCTMRLTAVLHPGWSDVTLESVASRLGVPVTGRHTARGDAVIAGAVMVELTPQLIRRGRTVGDALWLQGRVLL